MIGQDGCPQRGMGCAVLSSIEVWGRAPDALQLSCILFKVSKHNIIGT